MCILVLASSVFFFFLKTYINMPNTERRFNNSPGALGRFFINLPPSSPVVQGLFKLYVMCHCWICVWVPEQLHEYSLHPQELNVSICSSIVAPYDLGQKGWRISFWERWKAPRVKLHLSCIVNIDAENPFDFAIVIILILQFFNMHP